MLVFPGIHPELKVKKGPKVGLLLLLLGNVTPRVFFYSGWMLKAPFLLLLLLCIIWQLRMAVVAFVVVVDPILPSSFFPPGNASTLLSGIASEWRRLIVRLSESKFFPPPLVGCQSACL